VAELGGVIIILCKIKSYLMTPVSWVMTQTPPNCMFHSAFV